MNSAAERRVALVKRRPAQPVLAIRLGPRDPPVELVADPLVELEQRKRCLRRGGGFRADWRRVVHRALSLLYSRCGMPSSLHHSQRHLVDQPASSTHLTRQLGQPCGCGHGCTAPGCGGGDAVSRADAAAATAAPRADQRHCAGAVTSVIMLIPTSCSKSSGSRRRSTLRWIKRQEYSASGCAPAETAGASGPRCSRDVDPSTCAAIAAGSLITRRPWCQLEAEPHVLVVSEVELREQSRQQRRDRAAPQQAQPAAGVETFPALAVQARNHKPVQAQPVVAPRLAPGVHQRPAHAPASPSSRRPSRPAPSPAPRLRRSPAAR